MFKGITFLKFLSTNTLLNKFNNPTTNKQPNKFNSQFTNKPFSNINNQDMKIILHYTDNLSINKFRQDPSLLINKLLDNTNNQSQSKILSNLSSLLLGWRAINKVKELCLMEEHII